MSTSHPSPPLAFGTESDQDAWTSEEVDRQDEEVTSPYVDSTRALGELPSHVSRTESFASAAERAFDSLPWGSTAEYGRRARRVSDFLVATREAAVHALEVGHALLSSGGVPSGPDQSRSGR